MAPEGPDDLELSRSWDRLQRDVVTRGRRLRRRRTAVRVFPAIVLAVVAGVVIGSTGGDVQRLADRPPTAAPPTRLDRALAFARVLDGGLAGTEIVVVDGEGAVPRVLSRDPSERDGHPSFSPDGTRLAFQSERANPLRGLKTTTDVFTMAVDGSDVRRVTTTDVPGVGNGVRHPTWSPDGELLAAAEEDAADSSRIIVVRPDGGDRRVLTGGPGDVGPAWSPDGAWLAFRRRVDDAQQLWIVRRDGSGARQVAAAVEDAGVAWSPDGRSIAAAVRTSDGRSRIEAIDIGTGVGRPISGGPGLEHLEPAWAGPDLLVYSSDPDGQALASVSDDGTVERSGGPEPGRIVLARPDGSVVQFLTHPGPGEHDRSPVLGR